MNINEFSNEFDTILNSYLVETPYGKDGTVFQVDEYEKSIYLTKAQEELVRDIYVGRLFDKDGFESTEEIRKYLQSLITEVHIPNSGSYIQDSHMYNQFSLPDNLLYTIHEHCNLTTSNIEEPCARFHNVINVLPVTHDDFDRISNNPFRGVSDKRALRLDHTNNSVLIVHKKQIAEYVLKYLRKPSPIILTTLPEELTIGGIHNRSECELHSSIHREIINRAVQYALTSKQIVANTFNKRTTQQDKNNK